MSKRTGPVTGWSPRHVRRRWHDWRRRWHGLGGLPRAGWRRYGRHWWRPVVTALTGLAGLAILILGPTGLAFQAEDYAKERAREPIERQHRGKLVREGPVTFVVHEVRCGIVEPDEAFNGRRCEVTLGARNDGAEEITVPGQAQRLVVKEGARIHPVDPDQEPFGTLVPGEEAATTIAFDLPPNSEVTQVEVHADTYSRGMSIYLPGPPLPLLPD